MSGRNETFEEFYASVVQFRHPKTQERMRWFEFGHLPEGLPRDTSYLFFCLSCDLVESLNDGSQLTACLDKLSEAKDRAVRQAIVDTRGMS
jgi:hypothetical protein